MLRPHRQTLGISCRYKPPGVIAVAGSVILKTTHNPPVLRRDIGDEPPTTRHIAATQPAEHVYTSAYIGIVRIIDRIFFLEDRRDVASKRGIMRGGHIGEHARHTRMTWKR